MNHEHRYYYASGAQISKCSCGAYRIWDKETRLHTEYESEGESNE